MNHRGSLGEIHLHHESRETNMGRIVQHLKKTRLSKPPPRRSEHFSVHSFIADEVITTDKSKGMLIQMYPYYPKEVQCCSAFMTIPQLAWKINWHWEMLLTMMRVALGMSGLGKADAALTQGMVQELLDVSPRPSEGYIELDDPNNPADASTLEQVNHRHGVLMSCKSRFKSILARSALRSKKIVWPPGSPSRLQTIHKDWWQHSINVVDPPEESTHGKDYAFDLGFTDEMYNKLKARIEIEDISLALGCDFRNDETTHVHVEFPDGVQG